MLIKFSVDNNIKYQDLLYEFIIEKIKSNYNPSLYHDAKIIPLQLLPETEKQKRFDALNIELFDLLTKHKLMTADFFNNEDLTFDENHFFFCELFRAVTLKCFNEQDFNEMKKIIEDFPDKNYNYYTEQLYGLIESTTLKYETAKNYEFLLTYKHSQVKVNSKKSSLEKIWLPQPKISIDDFLKKGIDKGLWDESFNIKLGRSSLFGTGKIFLASLSIALKGYAINENIDHKIIGENLCDAFNVKIDQNTNNPFKSFQTGNVKYIRFLKREFNVI